MAQQLIVEGNDAIALANLLIKRELSPPRGYNNPIAFKHDFVVAAGGYAKAIMAFKEALDKPDLKNIGIVIDADDKGANSRWAEISNILTNKGFEFLIQDVQLSSTGIILSDQNLLTIGIWIMPDNSSNGYLEHFLGKLITSEDPLWIYVKDTISGLAEKKLQKFSQAKAQKANIHTWLAWQKEPGRPLGQAIAMGYLNPKSPEADDFVKWFIQTFELSDG